MSIYLLVSVSHNSFIRVVVFHSFNIDDPRQLTRAHPTYPYIRTSVTPVFRIYNSFRAHNGDFTSFLLHRFYYDTSVHDASEIHVVCAMIIKFFGSSRVGTPKHAIHILGIRESLSVPIATLPAATPGPSGLYERLRTYDSR